MNLYSLDKLISETRRIAAEYKKATGKTLGGVSSEIAHYDAARLLDLELCQDKNGGYDAIGKGRRAGKKIQIKGRAIFDIGKSNQRIGQLKMDKEWDSIVLVLMNESFEPVEIFEAERAPLLESMQNKQSSRSKRGAMSIARFKHIARLAWSHLDEPEPDENQS